MDHNGVFDGARNRSMFWNEKYYNKRWVCVQFSEFCCGRTGQLPPWIIWIVWEVKWICWNFFYPRFHKLQILFPSLFMAKVEHPINPPPIQVELKINQFVLIRRWLHAFFPLEPCTCSCIPKRILRPVSEAIKLYGTKNKKTLRIYWCLRLPSSGLILIIRWCCWNVLLLWIGRDLLT